MVGLVHLDGEAIRRGKLLSAHCSDDLVHIRRLGLLDSLLPHVHADVGGFHRIVGDRGLVVGQVLCLGVGLVLGHEFGVDRVLQRLEVVPGSELAEQRLGVDAAQFFLTHRECHDRNVSRLQAGVAQFLVERHVGVAVDRRDHGRLAALRELLDVGDDGLVVGMTERGVNLVDVAVLHALGMQEFTQDLVGRARIDVVGAQQHPALGAAAVFAHQVFHSGDGLLVGGCARIEHVLLKLFAFVLDRIEQQAVQFLEDREDRFARYRRPAAEHHGNLVLRQQPACLFSEKRPVRRRINDHGLELLAVHAALGVDLVDRHQRDILERCFGDCHRA